MQILHLIYRMIFIGHICNSFFSSGNHREMLIGMDRRKIPLLVLLCLLRTSFLFQTAQPSDWEFQLCLCGCSINSSWGFSVLDVSCELWLVSVYSNCLPVPWKGFDEIVGVADQETGWNHLKGLSLLAFW